MTVLLTIVFVPPALFSCLWNGHWKDDVSLWSYNVRYLPDYYRPWADLAVAQNNKGYYAEAEESARFALSLNQDYFYAWAALGTSQIHRGLYREALDSYKSALRYPSVRGNRAEIYFGMGYGLSALDNNSEAQAWYEKALKEDPDHTGALTNLAILHCQNGNFAAARPLLERVIAKDPADKEAHFNLGLLYIQTGSREKAQIHIREVLKLDPDNARARQMLNIPDQAPLKQEYLNK
jgi:tetratricopeptide (TPR) repeat protein